MEERNRATDAMLMRLKPTTPEKRWKIARAKELRAAQTPDELRKALAWAVAEISRDEAVHLNGQTGSITRTRTYRDRQRALLRIVYSDAIQSGVRPVFLNSAFRRSCDEYPPETADEDLPMECVEGYDPYYNSTEDEAELAGMEGEEQHVEQNRDEKDREYEMEEENNDDAEAASALHTMNVAFALARTVHWNLFRICDGERAAYNSAVGAFVAASATAMFWILRKNPGKAFSALKAVGAALAGIYVADASLDECLAEAEM